MTNDMKKGILIGTYFILTIVPLIMGLGYSLLYSFGMAGLMNNGFTFEHWQKLLANSELFITIGYSIYITLFSLFFILTFALLFSWWLVLKKNNYVFNLLFLPLAFPPLIAAFSWYYILSPAGIISRIVYYFGMTTDISDFPRLVNDDYSVGIILTHIFLIFPLFTILFIQQAKKERMYSLKEISFTLGSTKNQFFLKVFMPLLLKKTAPLILLYAIFLIGAYEVPLLLGQSSPRMITVFISDKMTRFNLQDIPQGHAMAVTYSVLIIGITTLFIRKIKTV